MAFFQAAKAEKWLLRGPSVVAFDDRLQYYHKTIDDVATMPLVKDQECIRLYMEPLADAVRNHAKQWIDLFGKLLQDLAKSSLYALKDELEVRIQVWM